MVLNPRLSAASRCKWPFLHCWTKCQERKPLQTEDVREEIVKVKIEGFNKDRHYAVNSIFSRYLGNTWACEYL